MKKNVIAIDVGGSKIHAGVYEYPGYKAVKENLVPTKSKQGLEKVLKQIEELINDLKNPKTFAVGIGFPGYLNPKKGIIYYTPNIKCKKKINVYNYFKNKLRLPVKIENDANLFTLAEYELNQKKKNVKHMIGITLGTGFGGGIIINKKLYGGRDGFASEFGHVAFTENKDYEELVASKGIDRLRPKFLGIILSGLIHIFNPEAIAIGGAIAKKYPEMEGRVWKIIKKRNLNESLKKVKIYESKLHNPATLGAAILASKAIKRA